MIYLKNLVRSFKIKSIDKGVYLEGPLGETINDERRPDKIEPAIEIEYEVQGFKRWIYISLNNYEFLAERDYSWYLGLKQFYDDALQEWRVAEGRWFYFIPFADLDEELKEEDIFQIQERVEEIIEKRWS